MTRSRWLGAHAGNWYGNWFGSLPDAEPVVVNRVVDSGEGLRRIRKKRAFAGVLIAIAAFLEVQNGQTR